MITLQIKLASIIPTEFIPFIIVDITNTDFVNLVIGFLKMDYTSFMEI
jgi:hypothetical protein